MKYSRSGIGLNPSIHVFRITLILLTVSACAWLFWHRPTNPVESTGKPLAHPLTIHTDDLSVAEEARDLHWVLNGSRLMVAGRWLLDPMMGSFSLLPYETHQPIEGGGTLALQAAISPTGDRIAITDGQTLRHGPVTGPLGPSQALPLLLMAPEGEKSLETSSVLLWVSDHQFLVYQVDVAVGAGPSCSLFDVRSQEWHPVHDCPSASFLRIWHAISGPQGWLAIFSGGEGAPAMNLEQYPPAREAHKEDSLSLDLYPDGLVNAQFATNEPRLYLSTSCLLERQQPRPCEELDANSSWRLYTWSDTDGRLVLQRQDLPPHSVPHPSGTLWAWPEAMRICVAGTSNPTKCFALPNPGR